MVYSLCITSLWRLEVQESQLYLANMDDLSGIEKSSIVCEASIGDS